MSQNPVLVPIIKIILVFLIVLGGVGAIVVFFVMPNLIRGEEVTVPSLVGESYEQAIELVKGAGLQLDPVVKKDPSSDIPEGHVIKQDPPANLNVKPNKLVRLTLSAGSEMFPVPDVAGRFLETAQTILKNAGFQRGRLATVHSDGYPENTVIAQTPVAGSKYPPNISVHLLVSLGGHPKVLVMPDLRRMPLDEVRTLLESHGLKIGKEEYKPHPEIDRGLIINHEPAAGAVIEVGQVIDLEVSGSRRGESKGYSVPIRYPVSSSGAPYKQVRIVVTDERGSVEVVNDQYRSGALIEKPPQRVAGKTTVSIYEDNELVKKETLEW